MAGCKKNKPDSSPDNKFTEAVQSHLLLVKDSVAAITDTTTGGPLQIPDFDLIYQSAANIESVNDPEKYTACIYSLLGRASDVDCQLPDPNAGLTFPAAHHMDARMGFEWYYIGLSLGATDASGAKGRIGILLSIQKQRIIGLTTQKKYGFSDNGCMLFVSLVTATIDFPGNTKIIRRSENLQLPALGGNGGFSVPGQDFSFYCGNDKLTGGQNVLPLVMEVKDGTNMSFSLPLIPRAGMESQNAFFLQGAPNPSTFSGTGFTGVPSPGIYYSWPQLRLDTTASNEILLEGKTYTIEGGNGWMDHQLMMHSLKNAGNAVHPIPFLEEVKPYNGWSWQYFNLEQGDAYTGASFQLGNMQPSVPFSYGYYIKPNASSTGWESIFIFGEMMLKNFVGHPAIVDDPSSTQVLYPSEWEYANITSVGVSLNGKATPWFIDGTFNGQSLQVISENPVDYEDLSATHNDGVGYCESVGFEIVDSYRQRVKAYLLSK